MNNFSSYKNKCYQLNLIIFFVEHIFCFVEHIFCFVEHIICFVEHKLLC